MKLSAPICVVAAIVAAMVLLDATAGQAGPRRGSFGASQTKVLKAPKARPGRHAGPRIKQYRRRGAATQFNRRLRRRIERSSGPRRLSVGKRRIHKRALGRKRLIGKKALGRKALSRKRLIDKKGLIGKQRRLRAARPGGKAARRLLKNPYLKLGKSRIRNLPIRRRIAGIGKIRGRVHLPRKLTPKLTLIRPPKHAFKYRMAPFVQRHWKKRFFWVAVAGLGYLTVPTLYYDDFYTCVNVDDPYYDDCIDILTYAALEEEEVVRVSKPAAATYKYRAKPPASKAQDCPVCRLDEFVERQWNQSYSWVRIPGVGSVTVPDAHYDRFLTFAGADPPNYPQACQVLKEAAAAEGGAAVRINMPAGAEYRYSAEAAPTRECKSCTLEPFVDRKWNREFVWVQVPQVGDVTVREDYYERFHSHASAEPPDYTAACKVLVEAAAADTVMPTTALDMRRAVR